MMTVRTRTMMKTKTRTKTMVKRKRNRKKRGRTKTRRTMKVRRRQKKRRKITEGEVKGKVCKIYAKTVLNIRIVRTFYILPRGRGCKDFSPGGEWESGRREGGWEAGVMQPGVGGGEESETREAGKD